MKAIEPERLSRTLQLLQKGGANVEYFFEHLDSPDWIAPLASAGLFQKPFPAVRQGEFLQFPFWGPGTYLSRMAKVPDAQEQVAQVLAKTDQSDNPRVYECIADAAVALPAPLSATLTEQLLKGLELQYQLLLPEKVTRQIARLADAGIAGPAGTLFELLFRLEVPPMDPSDRARRLGGEARHRLGHFDYRELLGRCAPNVARQRLRETLTYLCRQLETAVVAGSSSQSRSERDYSVVWQPEVARPADRYGQDLRSALVDVIRDVGRDAIARDAAAIHGVVEVVWGFDGDIFRRLALQLLADTDQGGDVAAEVLSDERVWKDPFLLPESTNALAKHFGALQSDTQERYCKAVIAGPGGKGGRKGARERWVRDHLAIVEQWLSPDYREKLAKLSSRFGDPIKPGPQVTMSVGWGGEGSPLSDEEASQMPWGELVKFAQTWTPAGRLLGPSSEGLAGSIRSRSERDPSGALDQRALLINLPAPYLAAAIEGLERAAAGGADLSSSALRELFSSAVARGQLAGPEDSQWRWVRQICAGFIGKIFEKHNRGLTEAVAQELLGVLDLLAVDMDPRNDDGDGLSASGMDPVTQSLNCVRGQSVHSLMRYVLWRRRCLEAEAGKPSAAAIGFENYGRARQVFEGRLSSREERSPAVRAPFGQWFPWLHMADPNWATSQVTAIFSTEKAGDRMGHAAWAAYVVYCPPYSSMITVLGSKYRWAIGQLRGDRSWEVGLGEKVGEHLGQHLAAYYWRGEVGLEVGGLVDAFVETAPPELLASTLEWIGWSLSRTEGTVPVEVGGRLKALWSTCTAKAGTARAVRAAFGTWFGSGKLDPQWSLVELEALVADSIGPIHPHQVAEQLAAMVVGHESEVLRVLERMVDIVADRWEPRLWSDEIRRIVEVTLESPIPEVSDTSKRLRNKFGAMGFPGLRELGQR